MASTAQLLFLFGMNLITQVLGQDIGEGIVLTCDKPGVFALTFDDGPSLYTPTLLKTLKEKQVTATFFVLGMNANNPSISGFLKQAYKNGHQIALHTNTHPHLNRLSGGRIKYEMSQVEQIVHSILGVTPNYMRPPYGECNENTRSVLRQLNYTIINWNVDSNDWRYHGSPSKYELVYTNMEQELNRGTPASSFISLQHDIEEFSVNMTSRIIEMIRHKNYTFETVADCLGNKVPMYRDAPNNNKKENSTIASIANTTIPDLSIPSTTFTAEYAQKQSISGLLVTNWFIFILSMTGLAAASILSTNSFIW